MPLRFGAFLTLLLAALMALMLASLAIGRYPLALPDILRVVLGTRLDATHSAADPAWVVVEIVRLPRILGVTLCGVGLGLAGAAMQGDIRNPLVGPEVAGVSAGA